MVPSSWEKATRRRVLRGVPLDRERRDGRPGRPAGGIFSDDDNAPIVSADGSVVVGQGNSASGYEAFRWTSEGGMVGLGDLPGGTFESSAWGVSADGSVVVGASNSASGDEAFRWTSGAAEWSAWATCRGSSFSSAEDVSPMVRWSWESATRLSGLEAFRWTRGGGMVGLGDLPGGIFWSVAAGVSADGSVVVGFGNMDDATGRCRGVPLDRAAAGMVGLGDLPGGIFNSGTWDVSADGSVIVGYGNSALGDEAFLWTAGGGMQNLRELLIAGGATGLTGWTLTQATAVSADGRTIVGYGTNPRGQIEAWLAHLDLGPTLAGDFNEDAVVDAADYVVWRNGLGTSYTQNDYDVWRTHFAQTVGSGAAGYPLGASAELPQFAIPEPATLVMVLLGMASLFLRPVGSQTAARTVIQ